MRSRSARPLAALLLRPRNQPGPLREVSSGFNRLFERITHRYVSWSEVLIKKGVFVVVLLLVFGVAGGRFLKPSSDKLPARRRPGLRIC